MFLATTAIEEFWDKSQKMIFLGEWCKLYSRKELWMSLEYEDISFVWDNSDTIIDGLKYCDIVYEKTLIELTQILNEYHGINKDTHYYRIVLGDWLFRFIHQQYDKYLTLKRAFEKYPNVQTWLLDESQHFIPLAYVDPAHYWLTDKYLLQLYSQILLALGYDFERKKLSKPIKQGLSWHSNFSKKAKLRSLMAKLSSIISSCFNKKTITLTQPYIFSRKDPLRILFRSRFRCIFDEMRYPVRFTFKINQALRKKFLKLNEDEFESVLSKILLLNIPILFAEGLASFRNSVMKMPIYNSPVFFTAIGLASTNYIFKYYAAEHYESVRILNCQHGGVYGQHYLNADEEYDKSVSDVFYTAGWKKEAKTIPLSLPLFYKKSFYADNSSDTILFTINEMPRYINRLQLNPLASNYLFESLNQVMTFLKHFKRRDKLLIRTFPQKLYGWDTNERIAEHFSDCFFDDYSKPFNKMLRRARVFLTSCAYTTYLEALAANKPTVIFLSDKTYRFHPDAQPYYDRLQDVNILHYSPEFAAEHLNAIYDDVDEWWQSDKVQEARVAFVNQNARSSSNWVEEWVAEFNRMLAEC